MVAVGKEYRQTLFKAQYVQNRFTSGAVVCVVTCFAISDIQSSPGGDERSTVCQLCQKQHELWK